VKQAKPDGYTLFLVSNGTAVSASLFKSLPFDPVKDFAPVSTLAFFSLAIVVNSDDKFASLQELVAAGKSGTRFNVGTINIGSTQHLAAELFKSQTGIDLHDRALQELARRRRRAEREGRAGRLRDPSAAPAADQERLDEGACRYRRAALSGLAERADGRGERLQGLQGNVVERHFRSGGTPPAVVERLNKEIQAIVAMPDVKQKLLDLGVEARGSTPQALDQLLVTEIDKWKQVVARAKIEKQ
jgi:tripartite-type tricarboxylate transporter receptor subunit TctC